MSKIIAYHLCSGADSKTLNEKVQKYLYKGYQPLGGVAVAQSMASITIPEYIYRMGPTYRKGLKYVDITRHECFAQAMVKYQGEDDGEEEDDDDMPLPPPSTYKG